MGSSLPKYEWLTPDRYRLRPGLLQMRCLDILWLKASTDSMKSARLEIEFVQIFY
jgi:hypothetical protein